MPIYVVERDDHRQISADDLAKMMKIDSKVLQKIKKNPVFVINPTLTRPDKLNGGVIAPAGKTSKPRIFLQVKDNVISDAIDSKRLEIRYAMAIIPHPTNERISSYEPKRLSFYDQMDIVTNFEEALFKYCLPACQDSPVADKRNWWYSFQNKEAMATLINDKGAQIGKAIVMISNGPDAGGLTENQLMLIAKGIYAQNRNPALIPNPSAVNKTFVEVKADLVTLALKDPELFLNTCDDDVNEFYGMVLDAVDRGIFGVRTGSGSRGWYWEQGANKGELITNIGPGANDFDTLKGVIQANPNKYYASVVKTVTEVAGKSNLADFIKEQKAQIKAEPEYKKGGDAGGFVLPTEYPQSIEMATLFNDGKRPAPKVLGKFWEAIKEKRVTAENAKTILDEIIATVEGE